MRFVSRQNLIGLLEEYYNEQQNFCSFCNEKKSKFCQKTHFFEEESRQHKFNTLNSHVLIWTISYQKKNTNIVWIRPELKKNV